MEISGIGGYRDGMAARSSFTSVSTAFADSGQILEKPPTARSVGAGVFYEERGGGRQLTAGGHRASEPIMLDFDLPSTTATQSSQRTQKHNQQQKQAKRAEGLLASSSDFKRKNAPRLDNLQPPVNLSEERRAEYKQMLEDRIAHTLLRSQAAWEGTSGIFEDDPKNWKLHVNKPNLTMYRRRNGSGSDESISTSRRFVATGRIPDVTLQDLEYGLYADTTPDERAVNAYWFHEYFLDAAVLETYETRTDDDPFALFGVKWLLTGPFTHVKLIAPRDSAYMQYQKTVVDEYGEKLLVRIVDSVPEDIVPLIPDRGDIHFVRMKFAIIYIYRYDPKSKSVQVFSEGCLDPAGRSAGWMANVNLTFFAPVIVHLENIADAKYITKHGLMFPHETSPTGKSTMALSVSTHLPSPMSSSADQRMSHLTPSWVPDKKRKLCFVCFKSFSLLRGRHRHHCRMCGEVMCAECMVTLPLITPPKFDASQDANFPLQNQPENKMLEDSHRHGFSVVNQFKFCKKCLLGIRQERRAMVAGVGNYYFTEGMIHHYARMQAAFAEFDDEAIESGYLDSSLGEDESIVDEMEYSLRIEKLRQEHMEREKQKLRDQQKSFQQVRGVSVRLLDEATVSLTSSGTTSRKQSDSSDLPDFDDLEITEPKPVATTDEVVMSNQGKISKDGPSEVAPLLPIDIRRRSFSIPDHFEKMERSIAEQEALISSIQQQRAIMKAQQGDEAAEARLPIGAAMRSMAQTKPSVLSLVIESGGINSDQREDEAASTAATHSNAPSLSSRLDDQ